MSKPKKKEFRNWQHEAKEVLKSYKWDNEIPMSEPLDGDEVDLLAEAFKINLNWNEGNITALEAVKQLEELEKK